MDFDKAIEVALRTWYPKDHPLHFNRHHPLGKLLGEWGELLDDYMKSLYKPGYVFEPENELGDIWYYLRILCYQQKRQFHECQIEDGGTDYLIACVIKETSHAFINKCFIPLGLNYITLVKIARRYNLTVNQLTASNWEKLKPGSERGEEWMKTRMSANG